MKYLILRILYKILRKNPAQMPMVQYWKTRDTVQARVKRTKDGNQVMELEGEKYPVMSFPRGYVLFGKMSKLKHEIKNQVFNDSWWALEEGKPEQEVIQKAIDNLFGNITDLFGEMKYDLIPPEGLCPSVKEIHRAFTEVGKDLPYGQQEKVYTLRDMLCFILQEDDGYRFRVQDLAEYFNPNRWYMRLLGKTPTEMLDTALQTMVHCEVITDMKERINLLRRILLVGLKDPLIGELFNKLCKEMKWKKLYLSKADKYNFRGKYYKVDYRIFEY